MNSNQVGHLSLKNETLLDQSLGAVAAAQVAVVPSLPSTGPRAGAVMGTILGLAALASSLMWAFYR